LECFCYSFLWTRNWAELSWAEQINDGLWSWSPCQAHHAIHSQWVPRWNSSAVTPMFGILFSVYKWTKTKFVTWNWPQCSRLQIVGQGLLVQVATKTMDLVKLVRFVINE
jgi:hypothetical protein